MKIRRLLLLLLTSVKEGMISPCLWMVLGWVDEVDEVDGMGMGMAGVGM